MVGKIIFGIAILNILLLFFIIGINLDQILSGSYENKIYIFNSFVLWYAAVDFLLRCLFQPLPTINVKPYLRFHFRRKTIINYFLFRSFCDLFNLLPLLLVIPFSIKILLPFYGNQFTAFYLIGILLLLIFTNYMGILIRFFSKRNIQYLLIPIVLILFFIFFRKKDITINNISAEFVQLLMYGNIFLFGLLILLIAIVHLFTRKLLLSNFYLDTLQSKKIKFSIFGLQGIDISGNLGEIIRYISLETALLIRNKRPRQMFAFLPLFFCYFLYIILNESSKPHHQVFFLIMLSLILVIGPVLYGQFIFSWDSLHFDGIMARKNNLLNYIKAKYYLMVLIAFFTFIPLLIIFSIIGKIDLILFFSILLFIVGVIFFIILFWGTVNNGRIELSETNFFNYNAIKGNQFLLSLISILLPSGLFLLFKYLLDDTAAKIALALLGLVFIFFHEWWIKKIIIRSFYLRKYKNLEEYRKFEI